MASQQAELDCPFSFLFTILVFLKTLFQLKPMPLPNVINLETLMPPAIEKAQPPISITSVKIDRALAFNADMSM
jgi:hypothetical protein